MSGMMIGMTKAKIAVSLDRALVAKMRKAVSDGAAPSVSAYVEETIAARLSSEDFDTMLDEMLAETGGPLTDEERAWVDRILDS